MPHVREDTIFESETLLIRGLHHDDGTREVLVHQKHGRGTGVILTPGLLGDSFRAAVRREVPPEALAAVEAWLDAAG